MTTMELRASVFNDINALLENEDAMRKLSKYLRRLRNEISTSGQELPCAYTIQELTERIKRGTLEARQGAGQTTEELMDEAESW